MGDLCLDRYFEIDPSRKENSIETNLPVHNVTRVRCQPGAAGTILNNLVALGVGTLLPAAIVGDDAEGFALRRCLQQMRGVQLDWVVTTPSRNTFTYSKPLVMHKDKPPEELSRLDTKNWTETPYELQAKMAEAVRALAPLVDAMIVLDQVDFADTGVITPKVLEAVADAAKTRPEMLILADSRRSLRRFPKVDLKMNAAELGIYFARIDPFSTNKARERIAELARSTKRRVFVSMSEHGILGAHQGKVEHVPALPVRGEIDIVGAGDAVTANLTAAISAGASLKEALEFSQLASSIVIHQLGTTGAATPEQMASLFVKSPFA